MPVPPASSPARGEGRPVDVKAPERDGAACSPVGGILEDIKRELHRAARSGEVVCRALECDGETFAPHAAELIMRSCVEAVMEQAERLGEAVRNPHMRVHDGKPVLVVLDDAEARDAAGDTA